MQIKKRRGEVSERRGRGRQREDGKKKKREKRKERGEGRERERERRGEGRRGSHPHFPCFSRKTDIPVRSNILGRLGMCILNEGNTNNNKQNNMANTQRMSNPTS